MSNFERAVYQLSKAYAAAYQAAVPLEQGYTYEAERDLEDSLIEARQIIHLSLTADETDQAHQEARLGMGDILIVGTKVFYRGFLGQVVHIVADGQRREFRYTIRLFHNNDYYADLTRNQLVIR